MYIVLWIELKNKNHKKFVDALDELCRKFAKNNNYYFKFEAKP